MTSHLQVLLIEQARKIFRILYVERDIDTILKDSSRDKS
jgi:hypothetical protein